MATSLRWEAIPYGDDTCVAYLSGSVDIASANDLAALEGVLKNYESLVFYVKDLNFADTTFLRFLMRLRQAQHHYSRRVEIVDASPQLRRVLNITGMNRHFLLWPLRAA
jgi:anti-anti-sigma factor